MPYKDKADQEAWRRKAGAAYAKSTNLMRNYGITLADYNAMLAAQDGVCAICHKPPDPNGRTSAASLHVDHCHKTGRVRGLCCIRCNRAIGLLLDNPQFALNAAAYLAESEVTQREPI